MEFVTSGDFATGILRITALYLLGMRRLDFESPQHVASRNRQNTTGSDTPEKSHSVYSCEVAGGSSLVEPWDDSSSADALGFPTAGTWRTGRALRTATSVLAEVTYAIVVPRRPMGKHGPETERSPVGAVAVSPVVASCCEATRAARRRSVRACRER
jgi:hypothetical protein